MQKDARYHESAIQYNEELADFAESLAGRLKHEEVARWARAVSKQHTFHAERHRKALSKVGSNHGAVVETEDGGEDVVIEEQVVHRSAETGEYVSKEFADANPTTTIAETMNTEVRFTSPAEK